jgi:hypothetical protein
MTDTVKYRFADLDVTSGGQEAFNGLSQIWTEICNTEEQCLAEEPHLENDTDEEGNTPDRAPCSVTIDGDFEADKSLIPVEGVSHCKRSSFNNEYDFFGKDSEGRYYVGRVGYCINPNCCDGHTVNVVHLPHCSDLAGAMNSLRKVIETANGDEELRDKDYVLLTEDDVLGDDGDEEDRRRCDLHDNCTALLFEWWQEMDLSSLSN